MSGIWGERSCKGRSALEKTAKIFYTDHTFLTSIIMIWANFLHFYQPPTQKPFWVKKITTESYRRIVQGLLEHPHAKVTLNINGILDELLEQNGEIDVLEGLKKLLERGQIELTASAKYHPLLPMLPDEEIIRQVELNNETHRRYFGEMYKPKGFFPPEMAFSKHVAEVVAKMGYEWIIVDELSFKKEHGSVDYSAIYDVAGLENFHIFFRERNMSYKILSGQLGTGSMLVNSLRDRLDKNEYLLTAMDGETFGHHRPGLEHLLFEIYETKSLDTVLISELPQRFTKRATIDPLPSTWALMEKDLEKSEPFSRWQDSRNPIHVLQWQLTDLALQAVRTADQQAPGFPQARIALDRAIHSDQYWWASAKPWWSLEMIERGAKELRDTIMIAPGVNEETKQRAQHLYQEIIFKGFEWQREGIVEQLAHQEDEEVRQLTDQGVPELPKEEIDKIVANLDKEMKTMAERQEFERAAQLRDRIKELRSYEAA